MRVGKPIKSHLPCVSAECGSSDALSVYEDGTSWCFSCGQYFNKAQTSGVDDEPEIIVEKVKERKSLTMEEIDQLGSRSMKERKISKTVTDFYGVKMGFDSEGDISTHYYPYEHQSKRGYKVRTLPKDFYSVGKIHGLFGMKLFANGGKRLVITEGEIDALSVAQANLDEYGKIYPVVSVPSASGEKFLLETREWIRTFKEVVLCFDQDDAGQIATHKAIKIIGIDKVKVAKFPPDCKDPNDVLVKHGHKRLIQNIWDAETWTPAGIISKEELWEALTAYNEIESLPYPACLEGVNTKLKGMRLGEITLFVSGTGSGKSTIIRETVLHILRSTKAKVGCVFLEESPAESARKLAGMAINKNPADKEIPLEELKIGFDEVFGDDRVILLDHQGSIKDGSIVDQLEYMALMGCSYLFIDHITILVSEGAENLTGNEAIDKVMNDLLRLVKKHPVWIGLVSHLRKTQGGGRAFEQGRLPTLDDIRGSGSIKQISFDVIAFARNLTAEDDVDR